MEDLYNGINYTIFSAGKNQARPLPTGLVCSAFFHFSPPLSTIILYYHRAPLLLYEKLSFVWYFNSILILMLNTNATVAKIVRAGRGAKYYNNTYVTLSELHFGCFQDPAPPRLLRPPTPPPLIPSGQTKIPTMWKRHTTTVLEPHLFHKMILVYSTDTTCVKNTSLEALKLLKDSDLMRSKLQQYGQVHSIRRLVTYISPPYEHLLVYDCHSIRFFCALLVGVDPRMHQIVTARVLQLLQRGLQSIESSRYCNQIRIPHCRATVWCWTILPVAHDMRYKKCYTWLSNCGTVDPTVG